MSMRIVFLGTAGGVPTPERSLPAVLIQRKNEHIMFDCGEGIQRQMIKAKVGFHKKMKVFISHMHGDHVLGLPGMLQTMALMDRQRPIEIYGPKGIKRFLECLQDTLQFGLTFQVEIKEIDIPSVICEEEDYTIKAVCSKHVTRSFAYALIEKPRPGKFYPEKARALGVPEGEEWSKLQHGKEIRLPDGRTVKSADVLGLSRHGRKIVYTGDTQPFKGFSEFAANADLLIHEATFDDMLAEKAAEDGHSTPSQAAKQAKRAHVKSLILTHISARYTDASMLLEQAQKVFKNSRVAEDFLEVELPLTEL
jgi:ribonuclease Z